MGWRIVAALVAALLAAGCTAGRDGAPLVLEGLNSNPRHVEAATRARADPHTGVTTVLGPQVVFANGLDFHHFWLRGWLDPRNPSVHNSFQVVVRARFPRRVYLRQAYSQGERLRADLIDAERVCGGGCVWYETVGIPLTEQEMERFAETGFVFEITGRRDQVVVRVPAGHFSGFLAAFRSHRGGQAVGLSPIRAGSPPATRPPSPAG